MNKFFLQTLILLSLSACASAVDNAPTSADIELIKPPEIIEIAMLKYKFIPELLKINVGQTVRWVNKEKRQYHSIWFEDDGDQESDYMFPDDVFEKTFNQAGEYNYHCGPHSEMLGKIIVR